MKFYSNLSEHDKKVVKAGTLILAVILFVFFVFLPLKDSVRSYKSKISKKEKDIGELIRMSARYKDLKERLDGLISAAKSDRSDFTLFSFLDRVASQSNLKDYIKAMKPSVQAKDDYTESTVIVELEDVAYKPLFRYIHSIETSGHNLKIEKVDIKPRYSSPDKMNVTLLISAVELK